MEENKNLKTYESGMLREDKGYKIDFTLAVDGPMFERYAIHMTNGAKVHGARNWMQAKGVAELIDFQAGAFRHMVQYIRGDTDEDHAAAIIFNLNGAELCKEKLRRASLEANAKETLNALRKTQG